MSAVKRNILLNPGPATTTDTVKNAQVVPDICPREKEFGDLMASISRDLTAIAGGDAEYVAVLFGGSGTAAVDATINSVVPPGGRILLVSNGAYGERMGRIARAYGIDCVELALPWAEPASPESVRDALDRDPEISVVAMVHHETTTGLLNPVAEVGRLVRERNRIFVVDTISSFAGLPVDVRTMHMDFLMSTSNKCIQGMAGVAFAVCRVEALQAIRDYPRRSFYLSLYDQYEYFSTHHQMRFTPPVQTLYALRRAIDEFLEEGAEARYQRYRDNGQTLRTGLARIGFELLLPEHLESGILTTLVYPVDPRFDFDTLHDRLHARGYTIYPGKLGRQGTFRLANMGAIDSTDIQDFLSSLVEVLDEMGVALGSSEHP